MSFDAMRTRFGPVPIRRRFSRVVALLAATLVALVAVGCLNDLTPQGRWSSPVSDGNHIYVGNVDGVMVRVDAVDHNYDVDWLYPYELDGVRKAPKGLGAIYGAPLYQDGTVYGAGYNCTGSECNGEVFALSTDTGAVAWNTGGFRLRTKLVGQLQPTENGLLLIGTGPVDGERDPPGYLYAFSAEPNAGRRVEWRVPLDGEVWGQVAVDDASQTAYVGTDAGTLYAINLAEGDLGPEDRVRWTYAANGAITGSVQYHAGAVYFGDLSSRFYRLNPSTQSLDWQFDAGAWIWAPGEIDAERGNIYVATLGGHVYNLDLTTGVLNWETRIDGQVVGEPLVFNRVRNEFTQRVLAVPSGEHDVQVVDINDGQIIGTFPTDSAVKSAPVLIGEFIYIHTLDGHLKWYSAADQLLQGCVALKDGNRC